MVAEEDSRRVEDERENERYQGIEVGISFAKGETRKDGHGCPIILTV